MHIFLSVLIACLVAVKARDMGKTLKTMPFVTNSLVNLGKMDISFYLNARPQDLAAKSDIAGLRSSSLYEYFPKLESFNTEPCPCSNLKYIGDSTQNHQSELFNKILSGNDFFSFKEPDSSTLCCDSHENVKEDILVQFSPKQTQILPNSQNSFSILPLLMESMQNKPTLPKMPAKKKAVEIFFFPKNRELPGLNKFFAKTKNISKKDSIQFVGDKEIKNEFNSIQLVPPIASSVKKDLAIQGMSKHVTEKKGKEATTILIDNKSNIV